MGHPLFNRWSEHVAAMLDHQPQPRVFEAFWPDKWHRVIATMAPTPKGAGYSLTFPEETTVWEGSSLIILPKREDRDD